MNLPRFGKPGLARHHRWNRDSYTAWVMESRRFRASRANTKRTTTAPAGRTNSLRYDVRLIGRRTDSSVVNKVASPTAVLFRVGIGGVMMALVLSIALLTHQNVTLNERLSRGEARVSDVSGLLARHRSEALTREELGTVRSRLETGLSTVVQRITSLEARSEAIARVIATASQSVVFLQGAFGFVEEESGRPLRYVLGPNGRPLSTPRGPAVTLDGTGPAVEAHFTGTAFVATRGKLLITNRHVALPWEGDDATALFADRGLVPVMHRFVGYLPGSEEPFDVKLQSASEEADIAILQSAGIPDYTPHLELSSVPPRPGDDVVVMGYPTGTHALLARVDRDFVDELRDEDEADFWGVGRRLAKGNHINPLATRGIVGQVTAAAVVYDAETAQGGSGGPVLGRDGKVLAINAAIIPEFNGSNLGVPVKPARRMLACVTSPPSEHDLVVSVACTSKSTS